MQPSSRPRIKICCISSPAEARLAIDVGADALGLVSSMPSGPGVIGEAMIGALATAAPPGVDTFLLTCLRSATALIDQQRRLRATTLQLCDAVEPGAYAELRAALPGIRLVQVIHVEGHEALEEARAAEPWVDAVLLDSGRPKAAIPELGGTGRRHDWSVSRAIREALAKPIFLAGGLGPHNAAEAVAAVGPYGLDICSGVRRDGQLDADLLRDFLRAVGR